MCECTVCQNNWCEFCNMKRATQIRGEMYSCYECNPTYCHHCNEPVKDKEELKYVQMESNQGFIEDKVYGSYHCHYTCDTPHNRNRAYNNIINGE